MREMKETIWLLVNQMAELKEALRKTASLSGSEALLGSSSSPDAKPKEQREYHGECEASVQERKVRNLLASKNHLLRHAVTFRVIFMG